MSTDVTSANVAHAKRAAWPILICMGGISVTFCIYHAIHAGHMNPLLAVLAGFAPSAVAVGLSHVVAAHKGGWIEKIITGLVMAGAMILSAYAIAAVVAPAEGPELKWIFGGVLDTASMVALWVIFDAAGGSKTGATEVAPEGSISGSTGGAGSGAAIGSGSGSIDGPIEGPQEGPPGGSTEGPLEGPEPGPRETPASAPVVPQGPPAEVREPVSRYSRDPDAEKARAEYRKSVRRGQPLSDRALAAMYPGRSRNWAKARIREADSGPKLAKAQGE